MTDNNKWLDSTKNQINILKGTLSEKDYKKLKLRLLVCIAERVVQFYDECEQCQIFQKDISALIQDIGNVVQLSDKEKQNSFVKQVDKIANHLKKQHKLIDEGYYTGIGLAIGSGIGVALGTALEEIGGGIPIGIGIGLAMGAALDSKAKKEGKILCPKEAKTSAAVNFKIIAIILGLLLAGLAAFFFFFRFS